MFAINGPSGPTTRCERRVVMPAEQQQLELMRKQLAKQKSESFFSVHTPSSRATATASRKTRAPRAADTMTARAETSETATAVDATQDNGAPMLQHSLPMKLHVLTYCLVVRVVS